MKVLVAFSVFLAFLSQTLTRVTRINHYLEEARSAYNRKDFATAIYLYQYLNDSLQVRDREVKVNLAHAYFQGHNNPQAFKFYQPLLSRTPPRITSLIHLQLGVLESSENKEQALEHFKKALILNPQNEEARYNYELLKKYLIRHPEENPETIPPPLPEQVKAEKPKPNKTGAPGQKEDEQGSTQVEIPDFDQSDPLNLPQPNTGNSENQGTGSTSAKAPSEKIKFNGSQKELTGSLAGNTRGVQNTNSSKNNGNAGKEGEDANHEPGTDQTTYKRLQDAGITPEKARMLLEAMREAEIQYLQQIPRRGTPKSSPGTPNW